MIPRVNAQQWAALLAVMAVGTIVVFDWVPTALNRNIEAMGVQERLRGNIIHGIAGLIVVLVNLISERRAVLAGAIWFSVVLVSAVLNWWLPYLSGVHVGEISPEIWTQEYGRNLRVLPQRSDEGVVPVVQHFLIHLTLLAACAGSWWSFLSLKS